MTNENPRDPKQFWCELAWIGGELKSKVLIEVAAGRISSVACGVKPRPADAEKLAGLTIPGLANVHSHAFHRALRGRTQVESGTFWTWRERMYEAAAHLDPGRSGFPLVNFDRFCRSHIQSPRGSRAAGCGAGITLSRRAASAPFF